MPRPRPVSASLRGAGAVAWLLAACLLAGHVALAADRPVPFGDHHQHLLSPQGAALLGAPRPVDAVPEAVAALLRAQEAGWNDAAALQQLLTPDVAAVDFGDTGGWLRGPQAVAAHLSKRFAAPYTVIPLAWSERGDVGYLTALYSRGAGLERRNVGSVGMRLERGGDARWRIAMEHPVFPGPAIEAPLEADRLVALLDAAGIRRAAVLSTAYWFQSPRFAAQVADPLRAALEENRWTADQAARHPDRLVAFCSLNPISDAAPTVLDACVRDGRFKGLKLHFANSGVVLTDPAHVSRVRAIFAAANRAGLPIAVHARDGDDYGAAQARIFLEQLLPAAPDVMVQMAHLWGGAQYADAALATYAQAVAAGDAATRKLIFDVSDAAYVRPDDVANVVAHMRRIGMDRLYYGSDGAFDGHPDPQASWAKFRTGLPLTDAEYARIAANVAPYLAPQAPTPPTATR